jgi:hypothetical protein
MCTYFSDPPPTAANAIEEYIAKCNVAELEKAILAGQYGFMQNAVFPPAAHDLKLRLQRLVVSAHVHAADSGAVAHYWHTSRDCRQ